MYAHDLGPSRNLEMVAAEALKQGHRVTLVGNDVLGKNLLSPRPDAVITGLSSTPATSHSELVLGSLDAHMQNIPWAVLADTHRSWGREAAKGRISNAHLLIASPAEEGAAREFGYKNVHYVGGPPLWQEFATTLPARIERRYPEDKLIMVVGNKDGRVIDEMCKVVIQACRELFEDKWELIFKPHPNERPETRDIPRRAAALTQVKLLNTPARTTNLIRAVDCSVIYAGGTDTIAAAYMREPAVCYENDLLREELRGATGVETWFPAEAGACIKATAESTRLAIETALSPLGQAEVRDKQEEVYPAMDTTGKRVESRILEFLESLTA